MKRNSGKGFTLIEIMLAVALISVVALVGIQLLSPMVAYFKRSPARAKANLESRQCMETVERMLASGKAGTLVIQTPPTTPAVPSSQAQFQSVDGSSYTITWSTAPMNTVHILRTPPGNGATIDTILATNVTTLSFSIDYRDPAMIYVTFQMTAPLDSSGAPGSIMTILLANQAVHMIAS
jgi:prepilin-type N-terminal cleavage/methylation domain-containing protein